MVEVIEGEGPSADRSTRSRSIQKKVRISRIYKVVDKDLFVFLLTLPIIIDFRSIFEKDVAGGLGEEIPSTYLQGKRPERPK
jgi:hypothetical protein